jgi:hypothetical protein
MLPCALQDVDDLDLLRLQAVNHQIIAMDAAANPEALVARHQWVGPGGGGAAAGKRTQRAPDRVGRKLERLARGWGP